MKEDPLFPLVERYNMTGKVETQPIVDAVEVVRCKDCKYRDKCHREVVLKEYDEDFDANYVSFQKLIFCSYGKRREDDEVNWFRWAIEVSY